jgi:type I restriction enzyme R subunit
MSLAERNPRVPPPSSRGGSGQIGLPFVQTLFETMMGEQAPAYLPLTRGWDDKAKEAAIAHFADKEQREAFYTFYRRVQNLYDILSPDAALRPHIEDYQRLAELYSRISRTTSCRRWAT